MNTSFSTETLARQIADDYQWLIGRYFETPHGQLRIDSVEPFQLPSKEYQVYLIHDVFSVHSIPEFFGFINPKMELIQYLSNDGIPCNLAK